MNGPDHDGLLPQRLSARAGRPVPARVGGRQVPLLVDGSATPRDSVSTLGNPTPALHIAAAQFDQRVRASCWDSLAGEILALHHPVTAEMTLVCEGCVLPWPCRTYSVIAASLLRLPSEQNALSMFSALVRRASSL